MSYKKTYLLTLQQHFMYPLSIAIPNTDNFDMTLYQNNINKYLYYQKFLLFFLSTFSYRRIAIYKRAREDRFL